MAAEIARRAVLKLMYNGVDIGGNCVHAEYVDYAEGTMDELTVTLEDRDKNWQGPWIPAKGAELSAVIQCYDWFQPGDSPSLTIRGMQIGEIDLNGPPDQVTIQAAAVKVKSNARTQRKSKDFEDVTLHHIASHVAGKAGLKLSWEGNDNHFDRVDQRDESDMAFLRRLCKKYGNNIKTIDDTLFVYSAEAWDKRPPSASLVKGQDWIKRYHFKTGVHDKYRGCVYAFSHPEKKELIRGEYLPPGAPPTGEMLVLTRPAKDQGDAIKQAKARLHRKNRWEVAADFDLVGDPRRRATHVLALSGFKNFDGNYMTDEARHTLDGNGGYETALVLRRVQ